MFIWLVLACGPQQTHPEAPELLEDTGPGVEEAWTEGVTRRVVAASRAFRSVDGMHRAALPVVGLDLVHDGAALVAQDVEGPVLQWRLEAWGRSDQMRPVHRGQPTLGECTDETDPMGACIQRLELRRGPLIEWWTTEDNGVEQGFSVEEPPSGAGLLSFSVALPGATLDSAQTLTDLRGSPWDIGALRAWDADGWPLPASSTVQDGRLLLEVDDRGARYPVEVDPLYSTASSRVGLYTPVNYGGVLTVAGDVDGDGYDDLLVGAYRADYLRGRVWFYPGSASGMSTTATVELVGDGSEGETFGSLVDGVGDLDGDGHADFIVVAGGAQVTHVFYGSAAGPSSTADLQITAANLRHAAGAGDIDGDGYADVAINDGSVLSIYPGGAAGLSTTPMSVLTGVATYLAGGGDVEGDGYDDLLVGLDSHSSNTGRVQLYSGSATGLSSTATSTLTGPATSAYFGRDLDFAGDVNGDGYDDVIVGAYGYGSYTGRAEVFLGGASGLSTTAATVLSGYASGDRFGLAVSRAGDVNGDGYDDVVVGAYNHSSARGRVTVYHGGASGLSSFAATTVTGSGISDASGTAVGGGGDFDGDGYDDVVYGSPGDYGGNGTVTVLEGSAAGAASTGTRSYSPAYAGSSPSVSGVGDLNGDGHDDVAVGFSSFYGQRGVVYVFYGEASGMASNADTTIVGPGVRYYLGDAVAAAGDVNGDGYGDLLVGASNRGSHGAVELYLGSASGVQTSVATTISGSSTLNRVGQFMVALGDVDGDGYGDVALTGTNSSKVAIYPGAAAGLSSTAIATLTGTSGSSFGQGLAAGDFDGDGDADLAVGAPILNAHQGQVDVFFGTGTGLSTVSSRTLLGEATSNQFGRTLGAGDVNADGYDDLVVGAHLYDSARGRLYVFPGSSAGLSSTPQTTLTGATSEQLGYAFAVVGDVDADGDADLLLGCRTTGCGTAELYDGDPAGLSSSASLTLTSSLLGFGNTVAAAGDLDGDGYADALVAGTYTVQAFRGYDVDLDGDGSAGGVDCDDTDATIYPGAAEICDGIDQDCDGVADNGVSWTTYADLDGDGYGDPGTAATACSVASGLVTTGLDCDDTDPAVNPGALESCNSVDDDCDGTVDEADATDAATWYADIDGDGFGDAASAEVACTQPSGFVSDLTDCDDGAAAVNPGVLESCNSVDDDCDGTVDEADATDAATWYADTDGDGFGDAASTEVSCTQPSGFVSDSTDCDDGAVSVNPGVLESCNSVDDDCDGTVDEPDATDAATWYADTDSDGFGDLASTQVSCGQPSGFVSDSTDCDDGAVSVNPGALESCNSVDDDCDGTVDEADATDAATWYADTDSDGFGDLASTQVSCGQPSGFVSDSTDCDDGSAAVNPGALESCNSVDDDCDGTVDEADATDAATWYADTDEDGFGDPESAERSCTQPAGFVSDSTDCDDQDAAAYPGAVETWYDGVDQDCDGNDDDQDGDGVALDEDCDDADATRSDDCGGGDSGGTDGDGGSGDGGSGGAGSGGSGGEDGSKGGSGCSTRGEASPAAPWVLGMGLLGLACRRRAPQ